MAFLRSNKSTAEYKQQVETEEIKTTGLLNLVVVLAVVSVAYTDWIVVANISLGYLYVLPIALSAFINPLPITIGLAVLGTILSEFFGPAGDDTHVRIIRFFISLAGFLIVGFLVSLIAKQRARLAAEVRRQRDEYESDLLLAAQVQRQVLPRAPIVPGLELAAFMQTARLLGGDYYDFFQISDEIVDVVIADVSGKGAAASLLMPSLAVALRLRAHELSGPAAILKDLDECLKQITRPATFVTMFYARFNTKLRTLEYANGGHNPPLLLRPQTGESLLLENAGPIMGILPSAEFSNTLISLKANDVITLFTDGVTEQENESEEQFSLDRLKALVLSEEDKPATTLVTDISEAVASFAGTKEQEDDLTVVIVKVLPDQREG
ncbi:PP2C family protein-serine/threonine phosphatase [Tunturiibacter gelidoferens]|jgi:serine phosphatase RsbU (regulator of sigma subunit)|uniref:Sigma-B regulation protein RsbU (Phosphoserine phosphatase) n=1 Tax=Tunturiibacter gelidiferens TaxID=3069689 RepID=A0A9X0QGU8_9BACT|nr:PP2C family protein-serine/threonine phosphatase [Edaphobacter lichenicola]MBB5330183.1 sigma-B regulation protein RsbU (phosphoserine phosphatase) [Edaphobacter lichenicola]